MTEVGNVNKMFTFFARKPSRSCLKLEFDTTKLFCLRLSPCPVRQGCHKVGNLPSVSVGQLPAVVKKWKRNFSLGKIIPHQCLSVYRLHLCLSLSFTWWHLVFLWLNLTCCRCQQFETWSFNECVSCCPKEKRPPFIPLICFYFCETQGSLDPALPSNLPFCKDIWGHFRGTFWD